MFPHPEDLHRLHQRQHAEMIRNHTLERQARAAHVPTHRRREIGSHIIGFIRSRRWWKRITVLFTRHSPTAGTVATGLRGAALPTITPSPFPLGSPTTAPTESTRR